MSPRNLWQTIRNNLLLKVFALVFAIALWAFVNLGERDAEKVLAVPLELGNVPRSLVVTDPVPEAVDVRVRGPRTILGTLDGDRQSIRLDLSNARVGRTSFEISSEMLSLPRGVRVVRLSPSLVTFDVERLVERNLSVSLELANPVPFGFRIAEKDLRPSMVRASGPASHLQELETVSTEPLALAPVSGTIDRELSVRNGSELLQIEPRKVTVRIRLEEVVEAETFESVEIEVRNATRRYRLSPRWAAVKVRGPKRSLRDLRLSGPVLFVDASDLKPGDHRPQIQAEVPNRIEVESIEPEQGRLRVYTTPLETGKE